MNCISYYPGCTLKTKARHFEEPAVEALERLGWEVRELPRWNCCGASYSLPEDDLIHQVAPVRNLVRTVEQGSTRLLTLCAFCFHTLKRAELILRTDHEKKETINSFMDEEPDYEGGVDVVHLLELLRDDIGWEAVAAAVKKPLSGLSAAAYYGCTLVRPRTVAIDDVENPTVMQTLLKTVGCTVVPFPLATECCGAFQSVGNPDAAADAAWSILEAARRRGADMLVLACPLCEYNLGSRRDAVVSRHPDFAGLPVVYFTQLLALALGVEPERCGIAALDSDAQALLRLKGVLP